MILNRFSIASRLRGAMRFSRSSIILGIIGMSVCSSLNKFQRRVVRCAPGDDTAQQSEETAPDPFAGETPLADPAASSSSPTSGAMPTVGAPAGSPLGASSSGAAFGPPSSAASSGAYAFNSTGAVGSVGSPSAAAVMGSSSTAGVGSGGASSSGNLSSHGASFSAPALGSSSGSPAGVRGGPSRQDDSGRGGHQVRWRA